MPYDEFVPVSNTLKRLSWIYLAHAIIGFSAITWALVLRPSADCLNPIYERECAVLVLGFVLLLFRFRNVHRLRYHKAIVSVLIGFHALGVVVMAALCIQRWVMHQPLITAAIPILVIHSGFLIALLISPGPSWLVALKYNPYIEFANLSDMDTTTKTRLGAPSALEKAIVKCSQASRSSEDMIQAIDDLWEAVDLDQNDVLSPQECSRMLRVMTDVKQRVFMRAIDAASDLLRTFDNVMVNHEATRLANLALVHQHMDTEGVMSQLDFDQDGQVSRADFVATAAKVLFFANERYVAGSVVDELAVASCCVQ